MLKSGLNYIIYKWSVYLDNLADISVIKDILNRHGFTFSKAKGQNFLINRSVCPRMAALCIDKPECGVIEIGPGIGVLTRELAKTAQKVVAVELDSRLMPILNETLSGFDNITVLNDDILKIDLHNLIKEQFEGMPVSVCANLPYYITSPIIMSLLEQKLDIEKITVMVQKEAADRICARPGTRQAGAITLAVHYYAEPRLLFKVSPGSFMPAPKVDSAVISLNIRPEPAVNVNNEKFFFNIIKSAFSQRRKTAVNSISAVLGISKDNILSALNNYGINPAVRAEQLTLEQFADIANYLLKLH